MSFSPAWVVFVALGLGLALWMTSIQWRARGGHKGDLWAITVIGVPSAIVGGRLGHVLTAPDTYFGPDSTPLQALAVWDGGFSFWGAMIIGLLAVWLLTRYQGIRFLPLLDAVAPGLLFGHVAGAFSDWFDGRLELITVLAESVWNLLACVGLIVVSKRLRLGYGQVFALYLCLFGLGRVLLEALRLGSPAAADSRDLLGLSFNVWTAVATLIIGLIWLIISRLRHRTWETGVYTHGARTLVRRHRRGKHTYEVNAANIADPATGAPLPSVARVADPESADPDAARTAGRNAGSTAAAGARPNPADAAGANPNAANAAGTDTDSAAAAARNPASASAGGADTEADDPGIDLAGRHSFGFFGAVTSAISIVPDVRGNTTSGSREESSRPPER
jgi:prolipoprotein diacylglyceryltransferase